MPAALTFPIGSRFYDWLYVSEPEPHMNNRQVTQGRGKVLGGSSSINGMIFSVVTHSTINDGRVTQVCPLGITRIACRISSVSKIV